MDDKFYEELSCLINDAFDNAFGRKPKKDKKTMELVTQLDPTFSEEKRMSEEAEALYAIMADTVDSCGKSALINLSKIKPHKWNAAINELKDNNLVVQHGNKRGATYTVA
jgi:hypothetical protein